MRTLLLIAICATSGCATMTTAVSRDESESRAMALQSRGPARSTSGNRTTSIGLPLTRGAKIGLWAGVAVFLAYLMATDGEDDGAASAEP